MNKHLDIDIFFINIIQLYGIYNPSTNICIFCIYSIFYFKIMINILFCIARSRSHVFKVCMSFSCTVRSFKFTRVKRYTVGVTDFYLWGGGRLGEILMGVLTDKRLTLAASEFSRRKGTTHHRWLSDWISRFRSFYKYIHNATKRGFGGKQWLDRSNSWTKTNVSPSIMSLKYVLGPNTSMYTSLLFKINIAFTVIGFPPPPPRLIYKDNLIVLPAPLIYKNQYTHFMIHFIFVIMIMKNKMQYSIL